MSFGKLSVPKITHRFFKRTPNLLTLQHISNVLGYPVAFFLSDDDLIAEIIYWAAKLSESDKCELRDNAKSLALQIPELSEK